MQAVSLRRVIVGWVAAGAVLLLPGCKAQSQESAPAGAPSPSASIAVAPPLSSGAGLRPRRSAAVPSFPGAEPPTDATATASGIRYRVLRRGRPQPKLEGIVADVGIWTRDGKLAFSTYEAEAPRFPLGMVPGDLARAVADVGVGGAALFWLSKAALEPWRPPAIPPADVVLRLEVLEAYEPPAPTTRVLSGASEMPSLKPPDTLDPPPDATRTASGFHYLTLVRGSGKPKARDVAVSIRVDAWVRNGIALEPAVQGIEIRTSAASAPGGLGEVLGRVLPGSRTRVWVPARASGAILPDRAGRELVLEVELGRSE